MREAFDVPPRYFLSHSVGCLPKSAPERLSALYFKPWAEMGGNAWPSWLRVLEDYRASIGNLLGTSAAQICPQMNVSSALTKILYSLPKTPARNVIVLSPHDFPTNGFVFKQAERAGYALKFIDGDVTDPHVWDEAIDETTALVHITHALSNTSQLLPAKDICLLARKKGALSLVDMAQSVGVVPINVEDWGLDFAIGTGVKFLCCGPGACFLYASKPMVEHSAPIDVGWFSHENPFEMDIHDFRYAGDAMKFFGGTPSPAPFILANESLSLLESFGYEKIYARIQSSLSKLTKNIAPEILTSPRDSAARGAALVLNPPDRAPLRTALKAQNILHDERAEGFRFSVHGYTSEADLDALQNAISRA